MDPNKLVVSLVVLCIVGSEAIILNKGDVDGLLGDHHAFMSHYVPLGASKDVSESKACCEDCKNYFPQTQMFDFNKAKASCMCYKTMPGKRPVTGSLSKFTAGVCDYGWVERQATFAESQCPKIISSPGINIIGCMKKCALTETCSAINVSTDGVTLDCELLACPTPDEDPTVAKRGYRSYFMTKTE